MQELIMYVVIAYVAFKVLSGPQVTVGKVLVRGNQRTVESVVRSQVDFKEGEPLDPEGLYTSQRNLLGLGIFRSADVRILAPESHDAVKDVVVEVRIGFGCTSLSMRCSAPLLAATSTHVPGARRSASRRALRAGERQMPVGKYTDLDSARICQAYGTPAVRPFTMMPRLPTLPVAPGAPVSVHPITVGSLSPHVQRSKARRGVMRGKVES